MVRQPAGGRAGEKTDGKRAEGNRAEEEAARHLEAEGHVILERNFRAVRGEIDLITRDRGVIVFVEVKSATSDRFGPPEERVTWRKQRQIGKVALAFLTDRGLGQADCRFDVVSVIRSGGRSELRHIENAFWLSR
jgi:putative endonuclease